MANTLPHLNIKPRPLRESDIERYLCERVRALGGEVRKVQWIGWNSAPDRRVSLPHNCAFVELKAPGLRPTPAQSREHTRMRAAGEIVWVIDSFEKVDEVLG